MRALLVLGLALVAAPLSSRAALDASAPIVCAMVNVFDCSGENASRWIPRRSAFPISFASTRAAKTIGALDPELEGTLTKLDSVAVEEGKLVARALAGDRAWCSPSTRRRVMRS